MRNTTPCHHCATPIQVGLNRCPGCGRYNFYDSNTKDRKTLLSKVIPDPLPRLMSGPWDPCFGGGIVRTSVTLLAGEPGAGKSTLLMQIAGQVATLTGYLKGSTPVATVLYVATEENEEQIKGRADRLAIQSQDYILLVNAMGGMNLSNLLEEAKPMFVILDSLPGFTGQGTGKDEAIAVIQALKRYAEKTHAPAIVIDHITKDLDFAGYMSLMHAVDCLLMVKLDPKDENIRYLKTEKNRHGRAPCVVPFLMTEQGLHLHKPTETDT